MPLAPATATSPKGHAFRQRNCFVSSLGQIRLIGLSMEVTQTGLHFSACERMETSSWWKSENTMERHQLHTLETELVDRQMLWGKHRGEIVLRQWGIL